MWLIKLLHRWISNEVFYKRRGRRARRQVLAHLADRGYAPRRVSVSLGLGEPAQLTCEVYFRTDEERATAESSDMAAITEVFRAALVRTGFPPDAAASVSVRLHSDEQIARVGGAHYYRR